MKRHHEGEDPTAGTPAKRLRPHTGALEAPAGLVPDIWHEGILEQLRADDCGFTTLVHLRRTCRWFAAAVVGEEVPSPPREGHVWKTRKEKKSWITRMLAETVVLLPYAWTTRWRLSAGYAWSEATMGAILVEVTEHVWRRQSADVFHALLLPPWSPRERGTLPWPDQRIAEDGILMLHFDDDRYLEHVLEVWPLFRHMTTTRAQTALLNLLVKRRLHTFTTVCRILSKTTVFLEVVTAELEGPLREAPPTFARAYMTEYYRPLTGVVRRRASKEEIEALWRIASHAEDSEALMSLHTGLDEEDGW